jgi:hypothetical protein
VRRASTRPAIPLVGLETFLQANEVGERSRGQRADIGCVDADAARLLAGDREMGVGDRHRLRLHRRIRHRERAGELARPAHLVAEPERGETMADGQRRGRAARARGDILRFGSETLVGGLAARHREERLGAGDVEQRELEPLESDEGERRRRQ